MPAKFRTRPSGDASTPPTHVSSATPLPADAVRVNRPLGKGGYRRQSSRELDNVCAARPSRPAISPILVCSSPLTTRRSVGSNARQLWLGRAAKRNPGATPTRSSRHLGFHRYAARRHTRRRASRQPPATSRSGPELLRPAARCGSLPQSEVPCATGRDAARSSTGHLGDCVPSSRVGGTGAPARATLMRTPP